MKRGVLKVTSFCLAAGMTFTGMGSAAFATGETTLAGLNIVSSKVEADVNVQEQSEETKKTTFSPVGVEMKLTAETSSNDTEAGQDTAGAEEDSAVQTELSAEEVTSDETAAEAPEEAAQPDEEVPVEEPETEPIVDTSMSGEIAFAQCEEYINVRSSSSADSEVVGKVYNNGSVTILSQVGDWYEVQSGNAVGYVKAEYFAIGEEAQAIADEVAYNVATVYAEALTVRAEPCEEAEQIGMVYSTDELEVVQYEGDWMKVALGGDAYGYINAYYVGYDTYYATAETLEEEQARLDQEWLDYLAQQEAERIAAEQAYLDYLAQQQAAADQAAANAAYQAQLAADQAAADASYQAQATADAQAQADAQYQEYLAAQQAADAATQQADDAAVIEAAAQAQAAYQEFLAAQAAADAQAQAEADAAYQAQIQAEAAAQAQAEADAAQAAADHYQETYTEDTYTEDSNVEDSSYSSSLGQQIVNFATQFVGNPYVWGGTSLTSGADCSGFTQSVFANFGIGIPRTAADQSGSGTPVDLSQIQAGDLLFYSGGSGIGHVSIYMGNGQVVHASSSTTGIIISDVGYRTPVSARRYW